ncbi:hypothetical protein IAI10_02635 [Clostridium sp. 19966]|uniref:hypothetical protein n=1 Tax=Clostridium sp. 19966 TaxID=2768166 RepID=UPI0028E019CC|nr:hypothetical protein [Clostridium sp. 19966]MDT8715556.1 hypothetical protein [Clostridium sp. 19966]
MTTEEVLNRQNDLLEQVDSLAERREDKQPEDKLILQITRLTKEFINLPQNGGNTPEEALRIDKKKAYLQTEIKRLKEELLFNQYLELQSKEFKKDLIGYEPLSMSGKDVAIKVKFKSFWLHVYRAKNNGIEWY